MMVGFIQPTTKISFSGFLLIFLLSPQTIYFYICILYSNVSEFTEKLAKKYNLCSCITKKFDHEMSTEEIKKIKINIRIKIKKNK